MMNADVERIAGRTSNEHVVGVSGFAEVDQATAYMQAETRKAKDQENQAQMSKAYALSLDDSNSSSDSVVAWVQSARRRRFDPPATRCSTGGPGLQLGDRTPAGSVKQEAYAHLQQEDDRPNVLGHAGTRRVCCHLYSA